ncbi:MAG: putative multidrug resistance ABC transporter ATP-binding/permease protein YheI [Candidatus Celerinatantimonas neptuna]|nr:MAG: putative multidrug resistance ABC transporter ATP-binding/permease protein YheI [Candidatus Celerinatantimonas neptuna]
MLLFRHLNWFFRRYWHTYFIALVMLVTVGLINMAVPWMVGRSVDLLLSTRSLAKSYHYLIWLVLAAIIVYGLRYGWRRMLFGTSYKLGNILRQRFYHRLTHQGQAFYNTHSTGDLMARATNDIDAIEMAAGEGFLSAFDGFLTFVMVLVMMFVFIDWRLAAVALIPFPIMGYCFYRLSNLLHGQFKDSLEKFSSLNEQTQQAMIGIRMIKAMGREKIEAQQFDQIAEHAAQSTYQVERTDAKYGPVVILSLGSALLITLLAGGWQIHNHHMTVGQLTSFTMYLSELIWPMWAFGWLMNILQRGNAAMGRLQQLLNLEDSIADEGTLVAKGYSIKIKGLTFNYPETKLASLYQVSIDLPEQRVLGIAGPTGAGKSTLLQLIMRYWQTEPGRILIDHVSIEQYQLSELRRYFAYVPQDPFLFSTSIAENIRMGRPDATNEEIYEAAHIASIDQDIQQFPDGYETLVGERGVTLSGGQRQRLAIARALISRSPILILDDALSAVDVHTEQQILSHLRERRLQSVIIISHRLSALEHADEIIVLTHGEIIERGTHQELTQKDGWYARMSTYQQMENQIGVHQHV